MLGAAGRLCGDWFGFNRVDGSARGSRRCRRGRADGKAPARIARCHVRALNGRPRRERPRRPCCCAARADNRRPLLCFAQPSAARAQPLPRRARESAAARRRAARYDAGAPHARTPRGGRPAHIGLLASGAVHVDDAKPAAAAATSAAALSARRRAATRHLKGASADGLPALCALRGPAATAARRATTPTQDDAAAINARRHRCREPRSVLAAFSSAGESPWRRGAHAPRGAICASGPRLLPHVWHC